MSYQSGFQNPKNYSYGPSNEAGIPESFTSSVDQKMMSCYTIIKQVTSQSSDQYSNGLIMMQIPSGSGCGYLKSGSCYLSCRIGFTQSSNAANMIAFQGGLSPSGTTPALVASPSLGGGSASAIISRLNVSIGGVLVNSIQNYRVLHDQILNHCTSDAYRKNDSSIMEFTGKALSSTIANGSLDVVIPILAPIFNDEQSIPLFLLNSPIVVEILLNNVNEALAYTTTAVTEFVVIKAALVYECVIPSPDFEISVKQRLQSGSMWTMNTDDYYNMSLANSASINFNIGLNLSSIKGVLYTFSPTPVAGQYHGYSGDNQTDFKLYLDSRLINQTGLLDTRALQYAEFQRTIGALFDYVTTSSNYGLMPVLSNINVVTGNLHGAYKDETFCGGIACNRSSDSSFAFTGTPAQTINITRECTGTAGTLYLMILYSQMLMIDATGNVSIMR